MVKLSTGFILVLAIGLLGFGLLGSGITGLVAYDDAANSLCDSNSDCAGSEVCCYFYGGDSGACYAAELCGNVGALTKYEKQNNKGFLSTLDAGVGGDAYKVLIGFMLVFTVGLIGLYSARRELGITK